MPFQKGMSRAKGSGRKPGQLNKVTAHVKELARSHAPAAIKELGRLCTSAESEQARVAAIKEILDRAYGKAPQPMVGDDEGGPMRLAISWLSPED